MVRNDILELLFNIFNHNLYPVPQTVWKNGLIWLSRPSRTFLAFLDLNWPKTRSKTPKNDPNSQISMFSSKIHTQCLRLCGKVSLFGSLRLLENFWPKIGLKMRPKMTRKDLQELFSKFLSKINTQCLRVCGKMAFFGFLGHLEHFQYFWN